MNEQTGHSGALTVLVISAILLSAHLVWAILADKQRFPVNTIKIVATYRHITHKELETILEKYIAYSFFTLPVQQLQNELFKLDWAENAQVERIWPDTVKITLSEKIPVARWEKSLLSDKGEIFNSHKPFDDGFLPALTGPQNQSGQVLQVYKKLSKILSTNHLQAARLDLRENGAWELVLTNGVLLRLGKNNPEQKISQFCKAWAVLSESSEHIAGVDLRYPHGMAVQSKKKREDNG